MEDYLFDGNISVKAAVMGGMREVMEIIADENKRDKDTRWILHRAAERGIPIRRTSREEIDAAASGHTHGGQWRLPGLQRGLFTPSQGFFPKYTGGRYDFGNQTMLISRGLQNDCVVPRLFNPPEVVCIDLVPEKL